MKLTTVTMGDEMMFRLGEFSKLTKRMYGRDYPVPKLPLRRSFGIRCRSNGRNISNLYTSL